MSTPFSAAISRRAGPIAALLGLVLAGVAMAQPSPPSAAAQTRAATDAAEDAAPRPALGRPRICLVLSGGGARGAAHIGVIKVLEELRIPIDCIAGTSMGSIVGAAYASGMSVPEMEEAIKKINLETLFNDNPPRGDTPMQMKTSDYLPLAAPEFGFAGGKMTTPKGIISGVALEAQLRNLVKLQGPRRFDQLPIPFRAVATSLNDGKMYVFDRGELPTAMRASMSVPAIVAPLNLDGQLLVDGGLTRNLPVDVARGMGGDVIIAVNLGTPLLRPDQIRGFLAVSMQMINILTEQNVRQSLTELRPQDVLILPELGDFSAGDFDHLNNAVPFGETAARKVADQLRQYALPEQEFAALRLRQSVPDVQTERTVDAIQILGNKRVSTEVILETMKTKPGEPLDRNQVDLDMRRIYGRGDFESVRPDLQVIDGKETLVIDVTEKTWGPDYARVGLALEAALGNQATFDFYGTYRKTWINSYGAEWRNDAILGNTVSLISSFYQPFSQRQLFFVEPRVGYINVPFDIYLGNIKYTEYRDRLFGGGGDLGVNFYDYGEARVGLYWGKRKFNLISGPTLFPTTAETDIGLVRASVRIDQLDSVSFTRSGYLLTLDAVASRHELGASDNYAKVEGLARTAFSWGPHTIRLALRGGETPNADQLPVYAQFQLGGFLNMSGYRQQQLQGPRFAYARILYQTKLGAIPLFDGIYGGLAYEAAKMPQFIDANNKPLFQSATAYLAADTPLGVAYFGLGYANQDNRAIYLFLGKPF